MITIRDGLRMTGWGWFIVVSWLLVGMASVGIWPWYSIRSVSVSDAETINDIIVNPDRSIRMSHQGTYSVTIRRYPNRSFVCIASPRGEIYYHKSNSLPKKVTLTWWLGGEADMDNCVDNGFGAGRYFITSCHTVLRPAFGLLPHKTGCAESNVFHLKNGSS